MLDLNSIHFLVGVDGQPSAVQVDIDLWQQIVSALEDAEDVEAARVALAQLEAAGGNPEAAGWIKLDTLLDEWERDGDV